MSDPDEIGAVVWHSSDEESGPDVGLSLGLGGGRSLWLGELAEATLEEAGVAVTDGGMGWWLAVAGPNEMQVIAPVADPEAARSFFDTLARLIARPQPNNPAARPLQPARAAGERDRWKRIWASRNG